MIGCIITQDAFLQEKSFVKIFIYLKSFKEGIGYEME